MKRGSLAGVLLLAVPLLAGFGIGCGDFWQAPNNGNYTLSNSGSISVTAGATSGNTSTITVTPSNSFTGSVALTCAVTTSLSNPVSPVTCSLSPTSVSISDTSSQTSTLTAATTSTTSTGTYQITVTGTSGSTTETTTACVAVGSSATCSGGSGTSGVFYVLNQTTDQVVAMSISSGQLTTIGDAQTLPATPQAIAIAPNGQFLYVSTVEGGGIFLYTIASDGSLTVGNNGAVISSDPATAMQVDATNQWLVEAASGSPILNAINVNATGADAGTVATAGEREQAFTLPSANVTQLAISPGDSSSCGNCYVFVAMGSGGTEAIHFNPGSANPFGAAGTIQLKNSAGGDNTVAVDPSNRLLYVGESNALPSATQTGGLRAFTIANNAITELTASPYSSGGTGPSSIQPTADGKYVYVANQSVRNSSTDNIAGFSVTTTALSSIGAVAAGPTGRIGLAEDSTAGYILAIDFVGNPDLQAYTMSSGALTSALTSTTGTDPVGAVGIAAAP